MAETSGLPPEGWYPDRPNATRLRHWTGTGWTNEFRPIEPTPEPAPAPPVAGGPSERTPVVSSPVRETTDPVRSRRELRAQVGALVLGEPDEAPVAMAPPVAVAPTATAEALETLPAPAPETARDARPTPAPDTPAEPLPVIPKAEADATLSSVNRARVAGGYAPVREKGWQETFAASADLPTGSSQTFAGWLYAASPLWLGLLIIAGTTVLSLVNPFLVQGGLAIVGFAMTFLLARQDIRHLTERGYRAPSLWWVILPFFYFIVRMVRVGVRGVAMVVTYLLSFIALTALLYFSFIGNPLLLNSLVPSIPADSSAIPTPVATLTAQERANLLTQDGVEAQLRVDLAATFDVGAVDCVPFANLDEGTTTTCVVNLDGVDYNAGLQVTPDEPATAFVVTGMLPVAG